MTLHHVQRRGMAMFWLIIHLFSDPSHMSKQFAALDDRT
jgi:hypothetical protein